MTVLAEVAPWETFAAAMVTALIAATAAWWQGRKTRAQNTEQHAQGRDLQTDVRDRLLDLHGKVDAQGEDIRDIRSKVDELTATDAAHDHRLDLLEGEGR